MMEWRQIALEMSKQGHAEQLAREQLLATEQLAKEQVHAQPSS